mgnify:CR=1 FL=1
MKGSAVRIRASALSPAGDFPPFRGPPSLGSVAAPALRLGARTLRGRGTPRGAGRVLCGERNHDGQEDPCLRRCGDDRGGAPRGCRLRRDNGLKLTVRLERPSPTFLAQIAMPFFSAVKTNMGLDPRGANVYPSGGPYRIASRDIGPQVVQGGTRSTAAPARRTRTGSSTRSTPTPTRACSRYGRARPTTTPPASRRRRTTTSRRASASARAATAATSSTRASDSST